MCPLTTAAEMAMRAAELQGGPRLNVNWESAAVDVVAGREGGLCQYQFLGERYESLNAIVAAYSEHFKVPADKSRFCSWFWVDPASREAVVACIGRGGEGSFAIVRTKSERASYALFHNGPEGVSTRDPLRGNCLLGLTTAGEGLPHRSGRRSIFGRVRRPHRDGAHDGRAGLRRLRPRPPQQRCAAAPARRFAARAPCDPANGVFRRKPHSEHLTAGHS